MTVCMYVCMYTFIHSPIVLYVFYDGLKHDFCIAACTWHA